MGAAKAPRRNPGVLHFELRGSFVRFLGASPTYQDAVRKLQAEWSAIVAAHPELEIVSEFYGLPAPERSDDPLNAYIANVRSVAANTLRCRIDGAPADWVCHALHADVCGAAVPFLIERQVHFPGASVSMVVTTDGQGWVATIVNGQLFGEPTTITDRAFTPFALWKELKRTAHDRVDQAIDLMKKELVSATASWPRKYAKGYTTDTEVTMPKLVSWLVEGEQMFAGDRSATNTLLHDLGLDPPGRSTSEKLSDFPAKLSEAGPSEKP